MTYLDPRWTDPTGPFASTGAHSISAETMRIFSGDIDAAVVAGVAAAGGGGGGGGGLPETPLAVGHGGTGAADAAGARTNLGLTGLTVNPRGTYDNALTYNPGDIVALSGSSYILPAGSPVTGVTPPASPWIVLAAAGSGAVASVNAKTGVVVLVASDVGAVPTTRTVNAGTGLTGGGALSADRTLAVSYGTSAGTSAQGNDSRLSDQRTPLNGSVTGPKMALGAVDLTNMANIPSSTVIGNGGFFSGTPQSLTMNNLAGLLDQIITADQVGVSTIGGLTGPSVQTALQTLYDWLQTALNPRFQ